MCVNPKYLIKRKLLEKDGGYRDNMYLLGIALQCHLTTIEKWIKIEKTSKQSIPIERFYKMAEFFNCNPSDLING